MPKGAALACRLGQALQNAMQFEVVTGDPHPFGFSTCKVAKCSYLFYYMVRTDGSICDEGKIYQNENRTGLSGLLGLSLREDDLEYKEEDQ